MKPYNKKQEIGVASISYDETGKPHGARFTPSEFHVDMSRLGLNERLMSVNANSPEDAIKKAESIMAAWFVGVSGIEEADRELSRIESEPIKCEQWDNGRPKYCEVKFYFATTEPEPVNK